MTDRAAGCCGDVVVVVVVVVVRDAPPGTRIIRDDDVTEIDGEYLQTPEELDAYKQFSMCIKEPLFIVTSSPPMCLSQQLTVRPSSN